MAEPAGTVTVTTTGVVYTTGGNVFKLDVAAPNARGVVRVRFVHGWGDREHASSEASAMPDGRLVWNGWTSNGRPTKPKYFDAEYGRRIAQLAELLARRLPVGTYRGRLVGQRIQVTR